MSGPKPSDVHVDQVLTGFSIAYAQSQDEFIADRVFPKIPVKKQSDLIAKIPKGTFQKDQMKKRAPGTESSGGGWNYDFDSYFCHVYAHHTDISNQTKANADNWATLDQAKTEYLERIKLIRREKDFVFNFFKTGVWGVDVDGVASGADGTTTLLKWSDPASTPVEDFKKLKRRVHLLSGVRPNVATFGREVYDVLTDHADILSRIKTTGSNEPAKVTKQTLAGLFELDDVNIMDAIEDVAEEGQTASMAYIGGNHCMLTYRPKGALTPMTMMSGGTLEWTGDDVFTPGVSNWWNQNIKSWRYEIEDAWVQKVVCNDAGAFFENAI